MPEATVQIFTTVVNRPVFQHYQARLFRKYLSGDYRFHVVDDSVEPGMNREFENVCREQGLEYHRRPMRFFRRYFSRLDASAATAAAIQWTWDRLIKPNYPNCVVLLLDSDMLLIEPFDPVQYIEGYTLAGLMQKKGHVTYPWNGLMLFNMPEILRLGGDLDFSADPVEGCAVDTAGHLYYFVHRPGVRLRETDPGMAPQYPARYKDIDLHDPELTNGYLIELHCEGRFLHYRSASNWFIDGEWRRSSDPLAQKTRVFLQMIEDRL